MFPTSPSPRTRRGPCRDWNEGWGLSYSAWVLNWGQWTKGLSHPEHLPNRYSLSLYESISKFNNEREIVWPEIL